ncbi:TetR/AcrR family transcriptional regulator [Aeribacillus sp. FSL K6-2848]|uniref:TetR/AcrR family transcriptional regulator n=1 Tax=unclassified Aeribacillus TaxID=2640495 RepID=UPI0030D53FB7
MDQKNFMDEFMKAANQDLTPKQAKILQAAVEIFAEKGYAATSTSEIAKRAGVAEGTIFRHYKTKKDLLISIVSPIIIEFAVPLFAERFINEVFQDQRLDDFEDLLRKIIRNRYQFVKNNVPLLKIFFQEIAFHAEIQEKFSAVFTEKVLPQFIKVVNHFKQNGQIGDFPTETVIRLTINAIVGFFITRFLVMPDYPWDDEKEMEYTVQFIRNGLKGI